MAASTRGLAIVMAILGYMALGVPVWWLTTRIQRPALPHTRMQQAAQQHSALPLPISITLHIPQAPTGLDVAAVVQQLLGALSRLHHSSSNSTAALVVHAVVGNSSSPGDPGGCTSATLTWPPAHQPGPTLSQRWDHERGAAERLCKSAALQQLLPSERRPSAHPPHPETSQLDSSERQGGSQGQAQEQAQGQAQRQVLDRQLDHAWTQLLLDSGLEHPGSYHVLVLPPSGETVSDNPAAHERGARLMVGQHRSAFLWTAGHVGGAQAVVQAVQAAAPSLAYAFTQASTSTSTQTDQPPPLSATDELLLSFSLCNAEALHSYSTWDFGAFERRYLQPLATALSPAVRLSVDSEVLLYTPARQRGSWSQQHRAYVVKHSKLRHFLDSHWNLNTGALASTEPAVSNTNSGTSRAKAAPSDGSRYEPGALPRATAAAAMSQSQAPKHVLHFVAYVPPAAQRPLLLLLPNGTPSPTNSFHIHAWGGVHVVNPSSHNSSSSSEQSASSGYNAPGLQGLCAARAAAQPLAQPDMARFARAVVSQLRALLRLELREGLASAALHQQARFEGQAEAAAHALHVDAAPASETGFSSWEVDALLRQRAQHSAVTAARVLGSLSRLVEQLPTLEMPDLIGNQVSTALLALEEAARAAQEGDSHAAAGASFEAQRSAEAAFANPAVLAQLSYPPSHLIGVYLPLFAPLGMALAQALFSEVGAVMKERRDRT